MNDKIQDLRKKYFGYEAMKKVKIHQLPKVSFFTSNLDDNASLSGSNSDDDNRHYYRSGG